MTSENPYQPPEQLDDPPGRQSTIWLRRFRRGFLWWGAFPMIAAVLLISTNQDATIFLVLTAVWWLVGLTLLFRLDASFYTAFVMVCVLWTLAFYQTIRRVYYFVENQGFEGAGGVGSPLTFLLGLVVEQCFLFVPMSILLGLGIAALRAKHR